MSAPAPRLPAHHPLHGGPDSYRPGGGFGAWYLDLTNTTRRTCDGVHPVVVLVDAGHQLKPDQPRLEFYADGRAHPVRFETTDEDELVGVFADERGRSFAGSGNRTLTVKLRLALAPDTAPNVVTANAAVVQRHGDDGDWVGQSNDYRFAIGTDPPPRKRNPNPTRTRNSERGTEPGADPQAGKAEAGSGSAARIPRPQRRPPRTPRRPSPHPSAATPARSPSPTRPRSSPAPACPRRPLSASSAAASCSSAPPCC